MRKQFKKGLLFFIMAHGKNNYPVILRSVSCKVKKVRRIMLIVLVGITLMAYMSVWVSPATFKYAAAISIFIPLLLVINFITAMVMIMKRSKTALMPIILLLLGYPFFVAGISLDSGKDEPENSLAVLSYNVKGFIAYKEKKSRDVFNYIDNLEADISCFQEFYNQDRYVQRLRKFRKYHVIHDRLKSNLAIVSKYPVLHYGLLFEDRKYNNVMYADILLSDKDTVRVYNAHLESMGITHTNPEYYEDLVTEYDQAKTKFLHGAAIRAQQIKTLLTHAEGCNYPILIVGDFNDVPFSYNYFKVRRSFSNAFEKAGSGFGFTYNGDLPFLRIDNQFFSDHLEVHSFETLDSVEYSDHYPTLGIYSISD